MAVLLLLILKVKTSSKESKTSSQFRKSKLAFFVSYVFEEIFNGHTFNSV